MRHVLLLLTTPFLLVLRAQAQSLAIVLAGLPRGTVEETAAVFERAILRPLRVANIELDVYVAVLRDDAPKLHIWFEHANFLRPYIVYIDDAVRPVPAQKSFYSTCSEPTEVDIYHAENSKLEVAWRAVKDSGKAYEWVMTTRNDYVYDPREEFKPCWLRELPASSDPMHPPSYDR